MAPKNKNQNDSNQNPGDENLNPPVSENNIPPVDNNPPPSSPASDSPKGKKFQVIDSAVWGKEISVVGGKYTVGKDGFVNAETKKVLEPFFSIKSV